MSGNCVDVTAIGTLAVDYFAILPSIPAVDEKIMAEEYEIHPGGVAGNVLTQLGRLGVRAGWIGKIGNDEAGKILLGDFEKEGIDTSHVLIPCKSVTPELRGSDDIIGGAICCTRVGARSMVP